MDLAAALGNPARVKKWIDLSRESTVGPPPEPRRRPSKQRHRRLSEAEVEELVNLFLCGERHKDLATRFGVNRDTVTQILRRRGFAWERGLRPEEAREAARLYVYEGWSLARVGEAFGCHAGTVRRALLEAGVQTRPRSGRY